MALLGDYEPGDEKRGECPGCKSLGLALANAFAEITTLKANLRVYQASGASRPVSDEPNDRD